MGISLDIAKIKNNNEVGLDDYVDENTSIEFIGMDLYASKTIEVISSIDNYKWNDGYNVVYGKSLKIGLIANNEQKLAQKIEDKSFYLTYASF